MVERLPKNCSTLLDNLAKSISKDCRFGVGIDCTASSVLPVTKDGTPLCFLPEYEAEPHAYIHLWKHHAAQPQADRMTEKAAERNEKWLPAYGGRVSCESALPKLWQLLEESRAGLKPASVGAASCFSAPHAARPRIIRTAKNIHIAFFIMFLFLP